jgi:hypothetical protein
MKKLLSLLLLSSVAAVSGLQARARMHSDTSVSYSEMGSLTGVDRQIAEIKADIQKLQGTLDLWYSGNWGSHELTKNQCLYTLGKTVDTKYLFNEEEDASLLKEVAGLQATIIEKLAKLHDLMRQKHGLRG